MSSTFVLLFAFETSFNVSLKVASLCPFRSCYEQQQQQNVVKGKFHKERDCCNEKLSFDMLFLLDFYYSDADTHEKKKEK